MRYSWLRRERHAIHDSYDVLETCHIIAELMGRRWDNPPGLLICAVHCLNGALAFPTLDHKTMSNELNKDSETKTAEEGKPDQDVVIMHSPTEDGQGVRAIRARPNRVELAELRPLKEGQPINSAEVVKLKQRAETPLFDVETVFKPEPAPSSGPAMANSAEYRKNWDAIFGRKRKKRPLN